MFKWLSPVYIDPQFQMTPAEVEEREARLSV